MSQTATRRQFLHSEFRPAETHRPEVPRPVGAASTQDFLDKCTRCGDCAAACPQAIIMPDDAGYPFVDVSRRECTFCGICTSACEAGALLPDTPWPWRASISGGCLSMNGIDCRTCQDQCEQQAIRFRLRVGGAAVPQLDETVCIGCGACVAACPAGAITLARTNTSQEIHSC